MAGPSHDASTGASPRTPPSPSLNDWAIVIGIWDYPDLGDLAGPEHDAQAFAEWVQSPVGGGVPADHLRMISSSKFASAAIARDAKPTDAEVQALFDELDDIAQGNRERGEGQRVGRRLYLYMAGHGCAPLLDESVLLMANATRRRAGYHIPGKPWANWFYRAGYFDELLLFMDCCRESYPQAPLNVPAYIDVTAPDAVDRGRRFFAFGTKWSRLSRERPMADGVVRGVFTAALLEGLKGAAAEPDGRVTAGSLAGYLLTGMQRFLSPDDLADPEIPKAPDIELHPAVDPGFVIVTVPPPQAVAPAPTPAAGQPRLTVRTGDAATEIFVIDDQLHVVAQGAGELERALPPGSYLVKVRAGEATAEERVTLRDAAHEQHFAPLAFASPVPLANTALSDDAHAAAAGAQSRQPHLRAGAGSQIFILARGTGVPGDGAAAAAIDPVRGLTLRDAAGASIADLAAVAWRDPAGSPVAAITLEVDPGLYCLGLALPDGRRLEQTIVAVAGWQTQVFLLRRASAAVVADPRTTLIGAAVLMVELGTEDRFDPARPESRLVELARLALANRRQVLSPGLRDVLRRGAADPTLGILGGHLLLLEPQPDLAQLQQVVIHLRRQVGSGPHPDVEALALRLDPGPADAVQPFTMPPMLRQSWSLILDATVARPDLVPAGSPAAEIAARVWGEEPWLVWQPESLATAEVAFAPGPAPQSDREAELEAALQRQLAAPQRGPVTPDIDFGLEAATRGAAPRPDEATIRRLVRTLALPRARVEEMIAKGS